MVNGTELSCSFQLHYLSLRCSIFQRSIELTNIEVLGLIHRNGYEVIIADKLVGGLDEFITKINRDVSHL